MAGKLIWVSAAIALLNWQQAACAPASIESFAARARIEGVAISPDGRYLSLIQTQHGTAAVVVIERQGGASGSRKVVLGEPESFQLSWCRWATDTRLLCGYRTTAESVHGSLYAVTRLVAVNANGGNMRVRWRGNHSNHSIIQCAARHR